ncbi:MAG: di-heme oxidoredictase family protein [Terriglobia bacterium]
MRIPVAVGLVAVVSASAQVPRTWTQSAVDSLELPLARAEFSPVHIGEDGYYKIPERVLYKTYPVYAPANEPAGYMDWLKSRDPEVAFDASKLKTQEQWIQAGELVFNAPTSFGPMFFGPDNLRDPAFYKAAGMPIAKDGTIPFARWVVRKKGTVELGSMGCNTCHTRVLGDGTIVPGAQGNNPNDRQGALLLRASAKMMGEQKALERVRGFARQFEMPWVTGDINQLTRTMSLEGLIGAGEAIPPGVSARANTSMLLPPQIPDLIGVKDRKYLDHTGYVRQREIGDLMRYSSLAQDLFTQDRYGSNSPAEPRPPSARYSDESLYALARYIYSLEPPANPNRFDAAAARGSKVFEGEKCGTCHTAPLYTSNKLVAVDGFEAPREGVIAADVIPVRVGTDPRYATDSHKGTGYYKVPSLKGVWYRGPFGHNGSAATLAEWFDPARLDADYIPGGFRGFDGKTRSIPGHPFGLRRSKAEREDLIAFLRTL